MTTPTFDEDLATAAAALLQDAGKSDADEARSIVVVFRALEVTRSPSTQPDLPVLMAGFTLQSTEPMAPPVLQEELKRMRAHIDKLLATPPGSP